MEIKKIGILGSGVVAQMLGSGFARDGCKVMLGTRDAGKLAEWKNKTGENATVGSFGEAAGFGEIIFLCTKWEGTENAIKITGKKSFSGKIVVDVTNPLLFEKEGEAPKLAVSYPE